MIELVIFGPSLTKRENIEHDITGHGILTRNETVYVTLWIKDL